MSNIVKRDERGRIQKGTSLNPGGRPKAVRELLAVARESVPEALALANRFVADEEMDARVRLEAAKLLLSYGLGSPPKLDDLDEDAASLRARFESMSDDDLEQEYLRLLAKEAGGHERLRNLLAKGDAIDGELATE